jgi:predicted ATPase/class 3 adenylate cyclase
MSMPRFERKIVTVLFADLVGFTARSDELDPEDVAAILRPYHRRLRTELEHRGGTVEKFIGDAVMAVFGAPTAHEDDPERAVRAALAIRDAVVEDAQLEVRIGVNTGEALVSLDARPEAGEGMVAGDVVNTAARLQAAAPENGILVGESTWRATSTMIAYELHEPLALKGKHEPVRAWTAVEPLARVAVEIAAPATPLVGRAYENELLLRTFNRVRSEAEPQLVTLVGVPGIGKSRLVAELYGVLEAEAELTYWRQGRSLPYGEGSTFAALAEMAKAQAGILESDAAGEAASKLRTALEPLLGDSKELEWVERHLRPLLGLGSGSEDQRALHEDAYAAWRRFFEALADQRPIVLVFEDMHWADEVLLDFIDHLLDWAAAVPILVVCTARPELLERRPAWGGGKPNALTISLPPLSNEDTARLVSQLLERALLPAETQQKLLTRAGGNPLYAEQFVRMFQEGAGEIDLPDTVQGVIAARLDTLPLDEKSLLQDASVIGKTFWVGGVSSLNGDDAGVIEQRLRALLRKEFVRRQRRSTIDGESEYEFAHVLVREVAYAQIPRDARAARHRAAAEWIESLSPDGADGREEQIAHHYVQALELARAAGEDVGDLPERARRSLIDAADAAADAFAYASAERLYRQALELSAPDARERPRILFRIAEAASFTRGVTEEEIAEAWEALTAAGEQELAAELDALDGVRLWVRGDRDQAFERVRRGLSLVDHARATRARAQVLAMHARFLMLSSRNAEAIEVAREAIEVASAMGLEELHAASLNARGIARVSNGEVEGGVADIEESIAIAERIGTPEVVRMYGNYASILAELGEIRRAAELHELAREMSERLGAAEKIRWLTSEIALDRYAVGRWDDALALADRLVRESEQGEQHFMETPLRTLRGNINLARGRVDDACADAAQAIAGSDAEMPEPQVQYPAHAFAARAYAAAGDSARAREHLDELLASWTRDAGAFMAGRWLPDAVVAATALGQAALLEVVPPTARVPTRWLEALERDLAGDPLGAARIYGEIGDEPAAADARLRAVEQGGRSGDLDAALRAAIDFYRSVGATAYIRRAEALLPASA